MYNDDMLDMMYEDRNGAPIGDEQDYRIPFESEQGYGAMHEPDAYSEDLDWPDTGTFTD